MKLFSRTIRLVKNKEDGRMVVVPRSVAIDKYKQYGRMTIDQVISALSTKRNGIEFYQQLKANGHIIDPEATESVLRELGYKI